MTSDPATLQGKMPLSEAVAFFETEAEHRSYPVVDARGRLLGLVSRTDALRWQVNETREGTLADALSDAATQYVFPGTQTAEVADMMVESGVGRIPVVDPETRRVVGIISRQDLLKVRIRHKHVEKVRTRGGR
jgi:CBS domain-containing protein